MKRVISLVVLVCLLLCQLPTSAMASAFDNMDVLQKLGFKTSVLDSDAF